MADNENRITQLDNATRFLAYLLATCRVDPDGTVIEIRKLVARIEGVSIHVYSNEHPPPHFHVKYGGQKASFRIDTCDILEGSLGKRQNKIVKYWHEGQGKPVLIKVWDQTRPGDDTVGVYRNAASA